MQAGSWVGGRYVRMHARTYACMYVCVYVCHQFALTNFGEDGRVDARLSFDKGLFQTW